MTVNGPWFGDVEVTRTFGQYPHTRQTAKDCEN